jgi:membrane protein
MFKDSEVHSLADQNRVQNLSPGLIAMAVVRAFQRLWGRDVMLFTGGVSFFSLLAIVPLITLLVSAYSLLTNPGQATERATAIARLLPMELQTIFISELSRLALAPGEAVSAQGGFALVIGAYAAHRGFKAMLAGLAFIHDEQDQRGFLGFNLMALITLIAALAMVVVVSTLFLGLRVLYGTFNFRPMAGMEWFQSEWTWTAGTLVLGMALIYRYAMSREPVGWRASLIGGLAAMMLSIASSWASAFYVEKVAHLGATYGSLAAAVVLLIWISWTVNSVFLGGALATEIELVLPDIRKKGSPRL